MSPSVKRRGLYLFAIFGALIICLSIVYLNLPHVQAQSGHDYYIDSSNPNASDDGEGTEASPWKSLQVFEGKHFSPGDTVHFAAGTTYTGTFEMASSGTESDPITIKSYGDGDKPIFSNPGGLNILTVSGSQIRINGLKFRDTATISDWNSTTYMGSGAVLVLQEADDVTITNSEFTELGVGVKTYGLNTTIMHNYFHDLVIAYRDEEQSYGAVGISVNHSNTEIAYNTFVNCRSTDSPYGADGGAIEIEGFINDKNNIWIHHNRSTDSQGFIEVTETTAANVTVAHNISDDYQQFIAFDTTVTPHNFKVEHNTVVRTKTSNVTSLFTVLFYREEGPIPDDSWLSITNNIFYTPAAKVLNGSYNYKAYDYPRQNNVYYDGTTDPVGYPLGEGDMVADPLFVDFEARDLRLSADSPAIKAGMDLGYKKDFDGNVLPRGKNPDIGAFQYQSK
ncbi:choice-of-anchor Q domain-containing protein [Paenibacillus paeoniae]|uniref:Right handed beta helix domain-containing protein n=1 Tax=Paenibacillus paeoniae TaxID=2292705 RepID=A0A371PI09_9BACL|nr:choice-of-anchor Q domain-containing protein [Paenibacillus paeoniae]REK75870.1 hypothetical protein DX130_01985 [Paenibacillus paeoniae]